MSTAIPIEAATEATGEATEAAVLAAERVAALRGDLHEAAAAGRLTDEFGTGLAEAHVEANAALPAAGALIIFARAIETEAAARRAEPRQDCRNGFGEANRRSCAEVVLEKHEATAAAALAEALVSGPWPLF